MICLCLALAAPIPGIAQQPESQGFLILSQERILTGSEHGSALLAEEEEARVALRARAREIEMAFETEERELTELRASLDPIEFRKLADDFDTRVVAAREEQDARAAALAQEFDQRRRQFYADVAPILVRVMETFGAQAILDESSVFLADQQLNITDEVIAEIDRPDAAAPAPEPPAVSEPVDGTD